MWRASRCLRAECANSEMYAKLMVLIECTCTCVAVIRPTSKKRFTTERFLKFGHARAGVALLVPQAGEEARLRAFHETTQVHFAAVSDDEVAAYVATGESFDKAGAYGVQGALLLLQGSASFVQRSLTREEHRIIVVMRRPVSVQSLEASLFDAQ